MTTLDAGITDVQIRGGQSTFMAVATAMMAVVGFVATSLVLKSLAHLTLVSLKLVEDAFGQSVEYVLITAISMFAVRGAMKLLRVRYDGRVVFSFFLTISVLVMAFALTSGFMRVDFLISFLRMSALGLFAYLCFWKDDGVINSENAR